jgi:hypothetical protein
MAKDIIPAGVTKIEITPSMVAAGVSYLVQSGFLDTNSEGPIAHIVRGTLRAVLKHRALFSEDIGEGGG